MGCHIFVAIPINRSLQCGILHLGIFQRRTHLRDLFPLFLNFAGELFLALLKLLDRRGQGIDPGIQAFHLFAGPFHPALKLGGVYRQLGFNAANL